MLVKARVRSCREALRWLIRDGVAVDLERERTFYDPSGRDADMLIEVVEPDRTRREFQFTDVIGGG